MHTHVENALNCTSLYPLLSIMIFRLFHAKKLSWEAACLCIAVHLTKLTNCCDAVVHRGAESVESALYEDITSLLLGLLFTRALLFDKGTITFKKVTQNCFLNHSRKSD